MALLSASRDCHRTLRLEPSLIQLDRCAAFDDAVVQLQDRDPLWDQGPFSEIAVTGRQWSAASALSNDYLAIDGRLDRIRLRVELALAPRVRRSAARQPLASKIKVARSSGCGLGRAAPLAARRRLAERLLVGCRDFARQRIFEVVRRLELLGVILVRSPRPTPCARRG